MLVLDRKKSMDYKQEIERLIDTAITEDIGSSEDITTAALIPRASITSGKFVLKEKAVLAGLPFLETVFKKIDPQIEVKLLVPEGSWQRAGSILAKVSGPARGILTGERIALNLIQHASGVATATAAYVERVKGLKCDMLDTRKTLPGLRALEKYAVEKGGGVNHRYGLHHRFIIKHNHLALFIGNTAHPIREAVEMVKAYRPEVPTEIEISAYEQLSEALGTDIDAVMLDHMPPDEIRRCVRKVRKTNKKVFLELATITLQTVRMYAETGVDGIATSALTYFAQPTDIRMRLMI